VNSYAAIAFATPVAALLLGWGAVALHRRSLRARLTPEERAGRPVERERELDASMAALRTRLEESQRSNAALRAALDQTARDRARHRTGPDEGAVPAR
jgi:hypothetical protein